MVSVINRIRAWIDAKDHRPLVAAILIVEAPVIVAMWFLCAWLGSPWWLMPVTLVAAVVLISWVCLVMAALTRWFG